MLEQSKRELSFSSRSSPLDFFSPSLYEYEKNFKSQKCGQPERPLKAITVIKYLLGRRVRVLGSGVEGGRVRILE